MRSDMKMIRIPHLLLTSIPIFLLIYSSVLKAQVGIGGSGIFSYPGISESKERKLSLDPAFGYGFFFKHPVYKTNDLQIKLRYAADIIDHKVEIEGIKYTYALSNFNGSILVYFNTDFVLKYYTGVILQFISVEGRSKFRRNYSEDIFVPGIAVGITYPWAEGFDFFSDLVLQIGKTRAGPEDIPLNGFSFKLGLTMYLLEDEN